MMMSTNPIVKLKRLSQKKSLSKVALSLMLEKARYGSYVDLISILMG